VAVLHLVERFENSSGTNYKLDHTGYSKALIGNSNGTNYKIDHKSDPDVFNFITVVP
jgi:hypothetical protein